jgi:hypothetical protein
VEKQRKRHDETLTRCVFSFRLRAIALALRAFRLRAIAACARLSRGRG